MLQQDTVKKTFKDVVITSNAWTLGKSYKLTQYKVTIKLLKLSQSI
jgi:hypothetical protein